MFARYQRTHLGVAGGGVTAFLADLSVLQREAQFARAGKRSGAWMSEYRTQESFRGAITRPWSRPSGSVRESDASPS